ncbi:SDR family oxidoreductase [Chitinophaga sp. 30R24]|uniref:SDR family oxidoreductase n=1 Tax=Chitinophaga sp. 30R24 TaxID=3248838 RepID=UPI003B91FB74
MYKRRHRCGNRSGFRPGRLRQPEDIANMVTFLVLGDASFITGAEYNVDGGLLCIR